MIVKSSVQRTLAIFCLSISSQRHNQTGHNRGPSVDFCKMSQEILQREIAQALVARATGVQFRPFKVAPSRLRLHLIKVREAF
jgi:hypothetical protein